LFEAIFLDGCDSRTDTFDYQGDKYLENHESSQERYPCIKRSIPFNPLIKFITPEVSIAQNKV
jgi:hypothetical protein